MVSIDRQKRLATHIARIAAEILVSELKTPLPGVITVTGATVSRDLSRATVLYTAMGTSSERADISRRLRRVSSFIQREISDRLHMRVTPALTFRFDQSTERGNEVLRLLAELEKQDGDAKSDTE